MDFPRNINSAKGFLVQKSLCQLYVMPEFLSIVFVDFNYIAQNGKIREGLAMGILSYPFYRHFPRLLYMLGPFGIRKEIYSPSKSLSTP